MNRQYQKGSGNVYKDLGFHDAEEMQAKAALVSSIISVVEKKGWTQKEAAKILKITQPKISLLYQGRFTGFSLEKLIALLNQLNQDVEIVVKEKRFSSGSIGHVRVSHAYLY